MQDTDISTDTAVTGHNAVLAYTRHKASRSASVYRAMRYLGQRTGRTIGISLAYKHAKILAFKKTRFYHYADATGLVRSVSHLANYNPLTLYGRFLKNRSPKTSAYLLAYDNLIGLRPFYLVYFAYALNQELTHHSVAVAMAISTAKLNVLATAAQTVRAPMRAFDAACLLPNVIKIDPDKIDKTKRSDRLFAWSVRQAHKVLPRRVTGELTYRNRIGIHLSIFTKSARRSMRQTVKMATPAPQ